MKRKTSKIDFKESNLPSNRKELFLDVLKLHFRDLLKIGVVLCLFFLPFIVISFYRDFMASSFYMQYQAEEITLEEYQSMMKLNDLLFNAINAFSLGLVGVGLAGIMKIIKRLCFLDPVFFFDDFKAGVKDSGRHMFLLFFLIGVLHLINSYTIASASSELLGIVPSCISFAIIYPTLLIMMMALAIYNFKFFQMIYFSFMIYIKSALKTLLIYIICILFFFVLLIPNLLLKYGLFLFLILFVLPILLVGLFDYACSVFDKNFNVLYFPEIYKKGLVDKEKK